MKQATPTHPRLRIAAIWGASCILLGVLCILLALGLHSCSHRYDEDWILRKTEAEITERYGDFDSRYGESGRGYLTREARVGYLGTDPAEYFMIYFDDEGKAYEVKYPWYVPGG